VISSGKAIFFIKLLFGLEVIALERYAHVLVEAPKSKRFPRATTIWVGADTCLCATIPRLLAHLHQGTIVVPVRHQGVAQFCGRLAFLGTTVSSAEQHEGHAGKHASLTEVGQALCSRLRSSSRAVA
jgi:hypothetical protein